MMELTFSQAVEGYLLYAEVRELSPHTIRDYSHTFTKFRGFLRRDPLVSEIGKNDVQRFMLSLRHLKAKTRLNYHTGLSALWTWMIEQEQLAEVHVVRQVTPPEPDKVEIVPFSEDDIRLILASFRKSRGYWRNGELISYALPQFQRNRMITILLLDTGMRASEVCQLKIKDVDLNNRQVKLLGKGRKERHVPISAKTTKELWRFLTQRPDRKAADPVFLSREGGQITRDGLRAMLDRLQERARVSNVHAHRFRHTFAIQYLRNGGDVFTLQKILGHSSLSMVKRYLAIAQSDVAAAHRVASPVAHYDFI